MKYKNIKILAKDYFIFKKFAKEKNITFCYLFSIFAKKIKKRIQEDKE